MVNRATAIWLGIGLAVTGYTAALFGVCLLWVLAIDWLMAWFER